MEYRLVRSRRRSLALEVLRGGEVLVRAPYGVKTPVIEAFVRRREAWLADAVARQTALQALHPEPTAEEAAFLRAAAKGILPGKVAEYAPLVGVSPTRITITAARTRFGSCSGKNSISFSWRLMQYPQAAIDYVVVHELCHILHHDHGPAFYACVEKILPDWRERRLLLKK